MRPCWISRRKQRSEEIRLGSRVFEGQDFLLSVDEENAYIEKSVSKVISKSEWNCTAGSYVQIIGSQIRVPKSFRPVGQLGRIDSDRILTIIHRQIYAMKNCFHN